MATLTEIKHLKSLKKSGQILVSVLSKLKSLAKPGVSTLTLEEVARDIIQKAGAKPAFLGYTPSGARRAFPAATCISINNEVVHGIPNEKPRVLKEGDIVSLDTGVCFEGIYTDSAITVPVGKVDDAAKLLLKATKEALMAGIKAAKLGKRTGDIGAAVEKVALKYGFPVADDLGGHGLGFSPHDDPFVPNFDMRGQGKVLTEGMLIAIEPMLNEGTSKVRMLGDGYTFVTADGKRSAHFEHTVLITKKGPVIMTK